MSLNRDTAQAVGPSADLLVQWWIMELKLLMISSMLDKDCMAGEQGIEK